MPSIAVVSGPHINAVGLDVYFHDVKGGNIHIFMVGRDVRPGLCLSLDGHVSEKHCQIAFDGEHFAVIDCQSKHGTTILRGKGEIPVNPESPFPLQSGDRIKVGHSTLEVIGHTFSAGKTDDENELRRDLNVRSDRSVFMPKSPYKNTLEAE